MGLYVQPDLMQHCTVTAVQPDLRGPDGIHSKHTPNGSSVSIMVKQPPVYTTSSSATPHFTHLTVDRHSPKSRNCFMESGDGENLEKCSICLGTLARTAFFMMNRTNFMVTCGGSGPGARWTPRLRLAEPVSKPLYEKEGRQPRGGQRAAANRRARFFIYVLARPIGARWAGLVKFGFCGRPQAGCVLCKR